MFGPILQVTPPADAIPATETAQTIKTLGDIGVSLALVKAAAMVGRRGIMGHLLPEDTSHIDRAAITKQRDRGAVVVMAAAYAVAVTLTTAAVYLGTTITLALAWAGGCALVAAVVALQAAKNRSPVDDIRLLVEARRDDE